MNTVVMIIIAAFYIAVPKSVAVLKAAQGKLNTYVV